MLDYILEITFVFLSHFFAVYCTLYSSNEGLCIFIRVMHFKHLKKRSSSKFDTTRLKLRGFRLCADSHNADSDDSVLTHTEQIQTTLCWLKQSRFRRLCADSHRADSDSVLTHTAQIQTPCWLTQRRFSLCADSQSADSDSVLTHTAQIHTLCWLTQRRSDSALNPTAQIQTLRWLTQRRSDSALNPTAHIPTLRWLTQRWVLKHSVFMQHALSWFEKNNIYHKHDHRWTNKLKSTCLILILYWGTLSTIFELETSFHFSPEKLKYLAVKTVDMV